MTAGIRSARADALDVAADAGVVRIRETERTDRRIVALCDGAPESLSMRVSGRGSRLDVRLSGAPAELTLCVPRGCPVRVRAGGDAIVEADDLSGTLSVEARDGALVAAAGARTVEASAAGRAQVTVGRLPGVAVLRAVGAAEIVAARCEDAEVSATVRGRARIAFTAGRLAALAVDAGDAATVDVQADAVSCAVRRADAAAVRGRGPLFRPLPAPTARPAAPSPAAAVRPPACPSP
jgi:hypothetical protein